MLIYRSVTYSLLITIFTTLTISTSLNPAWGVKITATKGRLVLCENKYSNKKIKCEDIKTISAVGKTPTEREGTISEQKGGKIKARDKKAEFSYECEEAKCDHGRLPCKGSVPLEPEKYISVKDYDVCPPKGRDTGGESAAIKQTQNKERLSSPPYVIAPRHTLLLNDRPKFYWQVSEKPIPGQAKLYTITLCKQKRERLEWLWDSTHVLVGEGIFETDYPKISFLYRRKLLIK